MMLLLLLLFISSSGVDVVLPASLNTDARPVWTREGEIAVLECPLPVEANSGGVLHWDGPWEKQGTLGEMIFPYSNKLVVLRASEHEAGIYSCSQCNGSRALWQRHLKLGVFSGKCYREEAVYPVSKNQAESLHLAWPLPSDFPLPIHSITWTKNCTSYMGSSTDIYIESLVLSDAGYYTCTRSYWNRTQVYNLSVTWELTVEEALPVLDPKIIQPLDNAKIQVDVGKAAVVRCVAVLQNEPVLETLWWMEVERDQTHPVFYNSTPPKEDPLEKGSYHMTATLVFRSVSPEHLNTKYTCKLESASPQPVTASIILVPTASTPVLPLLLWVFGGFAVTASVITLVYLKLRIHITLLLRDLRAPSCLPSDGKQYDAYIMGYEAPSEDALSEDERLLITHILEQEYGYKLCIYERDILPGQAMAEVVLEHIGRSRRLVLLPTVEAEDEDGGRACVVGLACVGGGSEGGVGLLSGLHAALVERQTQLILVHKAPHGQLLSLPESLRLLARTGGTLAWRGHHSASLSSTFWKKLRYHMPPTQKPNHPELNTTL